MHLSLILCAFWIHNFFSVTTQEIQNGCLYTLNNFNGNLYLSVDESPQIVSQIASVILTQFVGNGTQIWKANLINEKERTYWLTSLKYPMNIVTAFEGQGSPYPQTTLLKFEQLSPHKNLYFIESLNLKSCLAYHHQNRSENKVPVSYENCNQDHLSQLWQIKRFTSIDYDFFTDEKSKNSKTSQLS